MKNVWFSALPIDPLCRRRSPEEGEERDLGIGPDCPEQIHVRERCRGFKW